MQPYKATEIVNKSVVWADFHGQYRYGTVTSASGKMTVTAWGDRNKSSVPESEILFAGDRDIAHDLWGCLSVVEKDHKAAVNAATQEKFRRQTNAVEEARRRAGQ